MCFIHNHSQSKYLFCNLLFASAFKGYECSQSIWFLRISTHVSLGLFRFPIISVAFIQGGQSRLMYFRSTEKNKEVPGCA